MADLTAIKYGLALASVALTGIFLLFVTWFTVTDISMNKGLKGGSRFLWYCAALFLPVLGALCYFNIGKRKTALEPRP